MYDLTSIRVVVSLATTLATTTIDNVKKKVIILKTFHTFNKTRIPILVIMPSYQDLPNEMIQHISPFAESPNQHPIPKYAGKGTYHLQKTVQPLRKLDKRSAQVQSAPKYLEFTLDDRLLGERLSADPDECEGQVNRLLYACLDYLPSTPLEAIRFAVTRSYESNRPFHFEIDFTVNFTVNNMRTTGDFSALDHYFSGQQYSAGSPYTLHPSSDITFQQGCSFDCVFMCIPGVPMKEMVENILKLYMIVTA